MSHESDKSTSGALTEGTRHRCGKGRAGAPAWRMADMPSYPARGCLVEAVGADLSRTKVKRRKASTTAKAAASAEGRYLSVSWAYWRRDRPEISCSYPVRSVGFRESGRP